VTWIALVVLVFGLTHPACAESASAESHSVDFANHLLRSGRLIGDPGGARSTLERLGFDLQLFYNEYLSGKPSGDGANRDGVFGHSGSYDFLARIDLESLSGWRGADVLLQVKGQYDRSLNADVGALSDPIDDADFDEGIYIDQLWFQQSLFDGRLRARVGFSEQQTVFDRNEYANSEDRQFLSTYLDNNGVVPLPNGLGAMLLAVPAPWLEVALGAGDADNLPRHAGFDTFFDEIDSLTGYLEFRFRDPLSAFDLPGNYRFGVFVDGRRLSNFRTGSRGRGHVGAYVSFDQLVWRERVDRPEGLGLFARAGYADRDVNRVSWFWSVGFESIGALPSRDRDVFGLGVYQAIGSKVYRDAINPDFDHETGIEFYYAIQAFGWLVVTPDIQYIFDPGARGVNPDALVGTLRFRVTF